MTTKKKRKTIAQCMAEALINESHECRLNGWPERWRVYFGELDILDGAVTIAQEAGHNMPYHPMNRHNKILNALRSSKMFDNTLYMTSGDSRGRERRIQVFSLKEEYRTIKNET